jgi:cytochrome c peroxidase
MALVHKANPIGLLARLPPLARCLMIYLPSKCVEIHRQFIPELSSAPDLSGRIGSLNTGGPTTTNANSFFSDLGSNGRTCFTCHQPGDGWGIGAITIRTTFYRSRGEAPIFRLVDGAVCPTADVSNDSAKLKAYSLVLKKGLIRIGLPLPVSAEFTISAVDDPTTVILILRPD